jgi:hypothetical protein
MKILYFATGIWCQKGAMRRNQLIARRCAKNCTLCRLRAEKRRNFGFNKTIKHFIQTEYWWKGGSGI